MQITINGETKAINEEVKTIHHLLLYLHLKPATIAVEKNEEIIDRNNYAMEKINPGDVIELIRFMGGG